MARRYGVYIARLEQPASVSRVDRPVRDRDVRRPRLADAPSVFVATEDAVYNEVFIWGPQDVREEGPWPLRNVVAQNKKVPLTPIEELLQVSNGPSTGADGDREPAALPAGGDEGAGSDSRRACRPSQFGYGFGDAPAGVDPAPTPRRTTCAASTSWAPTS